MNESISPGRMTALVDGFDRSPAYAGLAVALRELIGDGRIGYGVRLPSERELTATLGVSRTTVTRAYAALRDSGYAEARQGAGTFTRLPGGRMRAHDRALYPALHDPDGISMICAASTAPPGIAAAYQVAVAQLPAYLGGTGYFPAGLPALQAEIAAWYDAQGIPTAAEQILVTPGALSALAVIGRALAGPRDKILVDSPTYPNATEALRTGGGRIVVAPLETTGWDLDAYEAALRRHRPRLAYLMPDFHNPTGLVMTRSQRRDLAARVQRHGGTAVVDEAHRHLRLDGGPDLASFATFATDALSVGSASKSIWSGLRIGWVRSPRPLVDRLTRARVTLDLGTPVLEQLVLAGLFRDGIDGVLQAHRDRLRQQRDVLAAALAASLPGWRFAVPEGGMVLWCELPAGGPGSTALTAETANLGLHLPAGPSFAPAGGLDRFLRIPFTHPAPVLLDAVERLATAWARLAGGAEPPATPRGTDPMLVA